MIPPAAILCVNNDLSDSVRENLIRLLFINDVQDGYTFDANVAADPEYPTKIKELNLRIMIVRSFADRATVPTWTIPDIVMFIKQGLAAVEINKFGPTGLTLPVIKLYWGALLYPGQPIPGINRRRHHRW